MPLLDHFHPPLYPQRSWESFHALWGSALLDQLNGLLPRRYFAEVQVHLGNRVEADVAEFEGADADDDPANGQASGVAVQAWAPPAPPVVFAAVFPDDIEVHVRDQRDDARLVAVVELVSPRNKDRPAARRHFAAKCAAYLGRGIGLVVVDIVTDRHFNVHNELMTLLGLGAPMTMSDKVFLSATAYRPARRDGRNEVDAWPTPLAVGSPLPILPLAILGYRAIPLDLEASYNDARLRARL